ncbi:MAG: helix-turn-helix domain-containing protein [Erysipelotrichales bacterium]
MYNLSSDEFSSSFDFLNDSNLYIEDEQGTKIHLSEFNQDSKRSVSAFICQNINTKQTYSTPYLRIVYVLSGQITAYVDDNTYECNTGAIILANKHSTIDYVETEKNTKVLTFIFKKSFFSNSLLNQLSSELSFYRYFVENINANKEKENHTTYQLNRDNDTHLYVLLFFKQVKDHSYQNANLTHAAFLLFITEINRLVSANNELYTLSPSLLYKEMITYIQNNYNTISLQDIADKFNFHPNYISVFLKRETGKTFSEWIIECRLEHATNYLVNTNISIEKITKDIGYNDKSYFFKLFKKRYGVSPRQYRKQHKKD